MSRPIMVDSSWYIEKSRQGSDPLRELALVAEDREIAVCGLIMAELGRGIRERRFLDRYRVAWSNMLYVASTRARWEESLELAWRLDREGTVLPLQDIHISVCALHVGAAVLTVDAHFERIPGVTAVRDIV